MFRRKATTAGEDQMKKLFTTGAVLVTVFAPLASPAFAASPRERAPVANDAMMPDMRNANEPLLARRSDLVASEGRIIGADPDVSIRSELLRDRNWSEY
jgi:hypothetical protein